MNAADRYARCEARILIYEGSTFTNNPKDKGGPTKYGITLAALSEYRGQACSAADVQNLDPAERDEIYKAKYWDAVRGDDLPAGVDLICFDSAVNCGRGRAARWLQHALGVAEDGAIGPATLRALADASDAAVIEDIRQAREAFYRSLDDFSHWGTGWLNRLALVSKLSQTWVEART